MPPSARETTPAGTYTIVIVGTGPSGATVNLPLLIKVIESALRNRGGLHIGG